MEKREMRSSIKDMVVETLRKKDDKQSFSKLW